ncbi:MAG: tetratricopeptide repeat protein [Cytophagales bacterium]|nr:tetratricopeptide repeat protein [Cytophagales bacterium]
MFAQITRTNRYAILLCLPFLIPVKILAQAELTAADQYETARELYLESPDDARVHGQRAMDLALEERDLITMAKAHFLLGYIYDYQEDAANAFHFYFGGIRAYRKLNDPIRIQQLYENLAYIAERKGVHTVAEQLRRDRMGVKSSVDYRMQADMHYDLGLSLKHQGDVTDGIRNQLQALRILESNPDLKDTIAYANIWLELGVLNYMEAKAVNDHILLDSALLCYNRALHFNGTDVIHRSKVQNNRGNVHRLLGQYDQSKKYLFDALELAEGQDKLKIHSYFNLGRVYFAERMLDSAIWAFTRSLEINIDELNYQESQTLYENNIELSKAPELFGSVAYLDSLGIKDMEIRGRAMRHVYRIARDRYEIINASNNSMIAQLYQQHRKALAKEERWGLIMSWSLWTLLLMTIVVAAWFWWRRYSVKQHNRRLALQMEKRLKDKYGIELRD